MAAAAELTHIERTLAEAVIGVDTLWGGDVQNPSGTGRFIADSWLSDKPLPDLYDDTRAQQLRQAGSLSAPQPNRHLVRDFSERFFIPDRIDEARLQGIAMGGPRGRYISNLAEALKVMHDIGMELLGGPEVPYERVVRAATGSPPLWAETAADRERVAELIGRQGVRVKDTPTGLLSAVEGWRRIMTIPRGALERVATKTVRQLDGLARENVLPHLPEDWRAVPRANVSLVPVADAWFSGSTNYLGQRRTEEGAPTYDARYELNTELVISEAEFEDLIAHEVVPGHVTTLAFLQHAVHAGHLGFEVSLQTMNTPAATLCEGIANAALLLAHGVRSIDDLEEAAQLGVLLARLQDKAKNNASYMLFAERRPPEEVAVRIRHDGLLTEERAQRLASAWGAHPLLGRMSLPSYHAGSVVVDALLHEHDRSAVLPVLYGAQGPVDATFVGDMVG
jgi:hypothetical protein